MNTCELETLETQNAPQSPSTNPEPMSAEQFRTSLLELTPRLYVTGVLLALNVLVFVVMACAGVDVFKPTVDSLVRWGANYGPITTHGEWWRLLSSTFIHIGLLHLLLNMCALLQIGLLMERLLGNLSFTVLYLIAGIGGAFASLSSNPQVASAGASGAVFGLYGALLGYLAVRPSGIPSSILSPLAKGAIGVIGYNMVYGFTRTGIDMAAHLGGLACGFLCGMVLSIPLTPDARSRRRRRAAILAVVASLFFFALGSGTPRTVDFLETIKHFEQVEDRAVSSYNAALGKFRSGELKAPEFAALLDREILPAWNAEKEALAKIMNLPERQSRLQSLLLNYIGLRGEAWTTLASGLHADDAALVKASFEKQKEAAAAVDEISRFAQPGK